MKFIFDNLRFSIVMWGIFVIQIGAIIFNSINLIYENETWLLWTIVLNAGGGGFILGLIFANSHVESLIESFEKQADFYRSRLGQIATDVDLEEMSRRVIRLKHGYEPRHN